MRTQAIEWTPDICLWCGQYVESRRKEAGAPDSTANTDPCWATQDGDFGCDMAPDANAEGCGDHATKQNAAQWLLTFVRGES
jgi:hypothetical protein